MPCSRCEWPIDRLAEAGGDVARAYARLLQRGSTFIDEVREPLREINCALYQSEHDLIDPDGLPGREWFKSTMYATGIYTGFTPDPMLGVRQMIQANQREAVLDQVRRVAAAVDRMALRASRVVTALNSLSR